MTPWQLAKDSEFSHQSALFCFTAKAQRVGFKLALDAKIYAIPYKDVESNFFYFPIPELAFFHSVPNGTRSGDLKSRQIEGGMMKASGTKAGVLDTFWPLRRGRIVGFTLN